MPEVHFHVEWPDGEVTECYSPSTVVLDYFQTGMELTVSELVGMSEKALNHASQRVEARYGYRCISAAAQRDEILRRAQRFEDSDKTKILSMEVKE